MRMTRPQYLMLSFCFWCCYYRAERPYRYAWFCSLPNPNNYAHGKGWLDRNRSTPSTYFISTYAILHRVGDLGLSNNPVGSHSFHLLFIGTEWLVRAKKVPSEGYIFPAHKWWIMIPWNTRICVCVYIYSWNCSPYFLLHLKSQIIYASDDQLHGNIFEAAAIPKLFCWACIVLEKNYICWNIIIYIYI